MYFGIFSFIFFSTLSILVASPLGFPSPNDGSVTKGFDLTIGSKDYSKGQVASALLNELVQASIENGLIGGDIFFCPTKDGLYPDPFDCVYYFNCTIGFSTRTKCPEKLAFDNKTQTCIEHNNVAFCTELPNDSEYKCPFSGLHIYPKDCSKYYICVKDLAYVAKCEADNYFDNALRLCIPKGQALCLPEKSVPEIKSKMDESD